MAKVGETAPGFVAWTDAKEQIDLVDLRGRTVVLFFYPHDMTPGCTKEACDFRDSYATLLAKGAVLMGVSTDGISSHEKFRDTYELPFPLIADEDHSICAAYGVWQKKKIKGQDSMGIVRTTVIIDPLGTIAHRFDKVRIDGHVDEVLKLL